MLKFFLKHLHSDRADSQLVSLVFILPLVLFVSFTAVDAALYLNNQTLMTNQARDAARTIAIFGGNGSSTQETSTAKAYGLTDASTCGVLADNPKYLGYEAYSNHAGTPTTTECSVMLSLSKMKGLVNVKLQDVVCNPVVTTKIGESTYCTISWTYGHIPLSILGMKLDTSSGIHTDPSSVIETKGSSESEVSLSGSDLVARD